MNTELLTIADIKSQLNCAQSTIYRWIEQGEFPKPLKIGGLARWTKEDLETYKDNAVQRRNDAGLRPKSIRRGRPPHSYNKPKIPRHPKRDSDGDND